MLVLMKVLLSSVRVFGRLWEHLICEILCELGFDVLGVLRKIAVEEFLHGLQLGSSSINVGHYADGFMMALVMVSVGRG